MPKWGERKNFTLFISVLPIPEEAVKFQFIEEKMEPLEERLEEAVLKLHPAHSEIRHIYSFGKDSRFNEIEWSVTLHYDMFISKEKQEWMKDFLDKTIPVEAHREAVIFKKEVKAAELAVI